MIFWCNRNEMKTFNGKNKKKNLLEALADLQILTMRGFILSLKLWTDDICRSKRHYHQHHPLRVVKWEQSTSAKANSVETRHQWGLTGIYGMRVIQKKHII